MRDFAGTMLEEISDADIWTHTATIHARIQRYSIDHLNQLFALGCWDRRPLALIPVIDALVNDPEPLLVGNPEHGISHEQFAQLQGLAPRLKALCEEVDGLGIPAALTHGDFHAGNIAIRDGQPIYFDWSDGSVAHPFMDMYSMLERKPEGLLDVPERVRSAYLCEWEGIASDETIDRAWALAMPLSLLNQCISYQYIYQHTEELLRVEGQGDMPHYTRQLLAALSE